MKRLPGIWHRTRQVVDAVARALSRLWKGRTIVVSSHCPLCGAVVVGHPGDKLWIKGHGPVYSRRTDRS